MNTPRRLHSAWYPGSAVIEHIAIGFEKPIDEAISPRYFQSLKNASVDFSGWLAE